MIRVVLDTNVVVSALIYHGRSTQIVTMWKNRLIQPLVSKEILREYYKVFAYPKFHLMEADIRHLVEDEFLVYAETVVAGHTDPVIKEDPSDDKFLACADYGKAKYLVSGDSHLQDLKEYKKTSIVSIAEFLERVSPQP